jgi:hypothetical protein
MRGASNVESVTTASTGRRRAFRVLAVLVGLITVVFTLPEAALTWFDDGPDSIHHVHMVSNLGLGLVLGVGLLLIAWSWSRYVAVMQAVIAVTIAGLAAGLVAGDIVGGGSLIALVIVAILVVLYPGRSEVLRFRAPDSRIAIVPAVSLIPGIAYALTQARLQRDGVSADPHVDLHHYSGMAAAVIGIALAGLAASMRASGWRLVAWFAAAGWVGLGVVSLVFPGYPSALDAAWAWAAIAAAAAFVAIVEVVARSSDGPLVMHEGSA